MKKLNDILLVVAGLALLPFVADLIGGSDVSMWIAGLAIGAIGVLGLVNK